MSQQETIEHIIEGAHEDNTHTNENENELEEEAKMNILNSDMMISQTQRQSDIVDQFGSSIDQVKTTEVDVADSISNKSKKSASNIQGTRRASSTFDKIVDQQLEEQSRSSMPNQGNVNNAMLKQHTQTSQKSSSQKLTNLISQKQVGNKNFISKRSSVTNQNVIQSALRHQTSLNEDLQELEEAKKQIKKSPLKKPLQQSSYRQKKSMDFRGQSKDTIDEPSPSFGAGKLPRVDLECRNNLQKHKQSCVTANEDSPYKSSPNQNMDEASIHQSGQFELKTNEPDANDIKLANAEYRQKENMSPEPGLMINNASPPDTLNRMKERNNPPTTSTNVRNEMTSKDKLTSQNYLINKDKSSITHHSSNFRQVHKQYAEISNNPLMVGSLKSDLNATLLPTMQNISGPARLPQFDRVQPMIQITNKQEFQSHENSYDGTLEESVGHHTSGNMRSSSSNVEQGSSHEGIHQYMNKQVYHQPMPLKKPGIGEGLHLFSPQYLDQQKFMFQIMSQQQPYRMGKQSLPHSLSPNQIVDSKQKQQYQKLNNLNMTARSGGSSVSPRSSAANDSASCMSDKLRKELGTAIKSIKNQGLTQNIGLASKKAKEIVRNTKLLKQAALQQQKWMYDFQKDQNPFTIQHYAKPTDYCVRRELGSKVPRDQRRTKPRGKDKGQQSPSQHTYNLDLYKVQHSTGRGRQFGIANNNTDRKENDITLLKTNNSNATMNKSQRKQVDMGGSPFDHTRDIPEGGDNSQLELNNTSRMGLNEDNTNQALPAIGEIAADDTKADDSKITKNQSKEDTADSKDIKEKILTGPQGSRQQSRERRVPVKSNIQGQQKKLQLRQPSKQPQVEKIVQALEKTQKSQYNMEFDVNAQTQKNMQFDTVESQLIPESKRESGPEIIDISRISNKQKVSNDQMTFQPSEGSMPMNPRAINQTSTQLTKEKEDSMLQKDSIQEPNTAFLPDQSLMMNSVERHSVMSKFSRFEQGTGMDTMMINGRNVMIGQSRFNQRDIAGSTFSHSNNASSFREYSVLSKNVDVPNQSKLPGNQAYQNMEGTLQQVIPQELEHNYQYIPANTDKPKPAFGCVTSEIKPNFNFKSTMRRNTIKKQSELIRLNKKKAGVIKSIGDVLKQAKLQQRKDETNERLKEYLQLKHSYWQDTMGEESVLLGISIDTSQQDLQEFEVYQESIKAPPQIHYNEQMLSNYKYFGSRKFPEIDKIVINEANQDADWLTLPPKSLFNTSMSDEASCMPSISIRDGKGSISHRDNNSIGFASSNVPGYYYQNHPKTKQTQRGKTFSSNHPQLYSTLRQTLKTESQPMRESINRDIHTAFMNSQFKGIAPSTAKNFNNIRRKKIQIALMNKSSNNWSNLNMPATTKTIYTPNGLLEFPEMGKPPGLGIITSPPHGNPISINQQGYDMQDGRSSPLDDYVQPHPLIAGASKSKETGTEQTNYRSKNISQTMENTEELNDQHSMTLMKLPRVANASTQSVERQNEADESVQGSSVQEEQSQLAMKMKTTKPAPKQKIFTSSNLQMSNTRGMKSIRVQQKEAIKMNLQYGKQPTLSIPKPELRDSPMCQSYGQSSQFGKTLNMNTPESNNRSPSPPPIIEASESGKSKLQIQSSNNPTPDIKDKHETISFIQRNKQQNQLRYNRAKTMRHQQKHKTNVIAGSSPFYLAPYPPQKQEHQVQMDLYQVQQQILAAKQNCVLGNRTLLQTNPAFLKTHQTFQKKYKKQQQELAAAKDKERKAEIAKRRQNSSYDSSKPETKDASVGCQQLAGSNTAQTKEGEDTESTGQIIIINTKNQNVQQYQRKSGDTPLPLINNSLTPTGSNDTKLPYGAKTGLQNGGVATKSEVQTMLQNSQENSRNEGGKIASDHHQNGTSHSKHQSSFRTSDPRYILDLTRKNISPERKKMQTKTVYNVISPKSRRDGGYIPQIATLNNSSNYTEGGRDIMNITPQERKSVEAVNIQGASSGDKHRPKSYVKPPMMMNSLKSSKQIEKDSTQKTDIA